MFLLERSIGKPGKFCGSVGKVVASWFGMAA